MRTLVWIVIDIDVNFMESIDVMHVHVKNTYL